MHLKEVLLEKSKPIVYEGDLVISNEVLIALDELISKAKNSLVIVSDFNDGGLYSHTAIIQSFEKLDHTNVATQLIVGPNYDRTTLDYFKKRNAKIFVSTESVRENFTIIDLNSVGFQQTVINGSRRIKQDILTDRATVNGYLQKFFELKFRSVPLVYNK